MNSKSRILKQKRYFKLLLELTLAGIVKKEYEVFSILKAFLTEKPFHKNISFAVLICKNYYTQFFEHENVFLGSDTRKKCLLLLTAYYDRIESYFVDSHHNLKKVEKRNNLFYNTKADLTEDMKERFDTLESDHEFLKTNLEVIAISLKKEIPVFQEEEIDQTPGISFSGDHNVEIPLSPMFDNEEERIFYEEVIDLISLIPGLSRTKSSKVIEQTEDSFKESLEDSEVNEENILSYILEKESSEDLNSNRNAALEALMQALPDMMSKELVDKAAVDFCFFNNKGSRKRLIAELLSVSRFRSDILPYYCRLIATFHPAMPDIGEAVIDAVGKEFSFLTRKKTFASLQTRIKNVRYIAELTKFKIMNSGQTFFFMKKLAEDFTNQNVEMLCYLLEGCGRFLFHSPESSARIRNIIEIVNRKKNVASFGEETNLMIENAIISCNPPVLEYVPIPKNPYKEYVKFLLFTKLQISNLGSISLSLLKMPWKDPEIEEFIFKSFLNVSSFKYSQISLVAKLLSTLKNWLPHFVNSVVDGILEHIRIGLEFNNYRENQERISVVTYLGELFNEGIVESELVFDSLLMILTFGYPKGIPQKGIVSPFDSPSDLFRIRLLSTLVIVSNREHCLESSPRINQFVNLFQYYISQKENLTIDIQFVLDEVYENLSSILQRPPTQAYVEIDNDSETISESSSEESDDEETLNLEFDKELGRMISLSMESRQNDRRANPQVLDMAIPMGIKESKSDSSGDLKISLVMKKKNKAILKELDVPRSSTLAISSKRFQDESKKQKSLLKKKTMDIQQ